MNTRHPDDVAPLDNEDEADTATQLSAERLERLDYVATQLSAERLDARAELRHLNDKSKQAKLGPIVAAVNAQVSADVLMAEVAALKERKRLIEENRMLTARIKVLEQKASEKKAAIGQGSHVLCAA